MFNFCLVVFSVTFILQGKDLASQKAVLTDEREDIECGLVLRSIGYKGLQIDQSVPFDEKGGVIKSQKGRVTGEPGTTNLFFYCSTEYETFVSAL